jgi:tetratricopeptide (TPR) repeat protein
MSIRVPSFSSLFLLSMIGTAGLLLAAPLSAQQEPPLESSLSGVIEWEGGGSVQGFQVELNDRGGRPSGWADVRPDGSFEIRTPGKTGQQYILRIRNSRGQIVHDDIVQTQSSPLEIHLRAPRQQRPIAGVVSAEELRNEIPQKALKEFRRAQDAVQKGNTQRAIEHLHKAIQIHPQFAEAHNSLGVKFMTLADYAQAAAAFEEAVRLRPGSSEPLSNLGIALHGLNRYEEAEGLIRRALELEPHALKSRLALGLVLCSQAGKQEEALAVLAGIADQIPEAHFHAARMLGQRGDSRGAVREVGAYLDSGDSKYRKEAERWLQILESRAGGAEIR